MDKCPKCGGKVYENEGTSKKGVPYRNKKCENNRMKDGTCDYIEWLEPAASKIDKVKKIFDAKPTSNLSSSPVNTVNIAEELKKINEKLDKIINHYWNNEEE